MAKGMSFKVLMQLQTREFQKGIKNIQRQLQGFKNFMKSAFALGSITMFGREVVQVGKDFENAMSRVQAVSNATTSEFKAMQAEAQKLGKTTRYTATEAAEALENLTRNGMSAANATKALSGVLQLAQANAIGLADAANIITNTLNMFNLSVEETSRVNDVLSSTASHAATDITSLYEAMVNAAPAANVLGFSIEEVSSAIGALAQKGVKGSEAGTKLRIAFQKMADPKVIGKMKDFGIDVDEATMKSEGLRKTIEKIAKANLSLGQLGGIFDAKSAMAIQLMVSSLDDLDYMLGVTANSAGETQRMFEQGVGSVQKELDTLKSMYEGLLISISQKTSGAVKSVVKLLQNLIANFETVGGTILNIASVAVPLLTKRVITLGTTLKTMFAQAAAGAATLKVAMGDIVTIVATLVTWVGTALYSAWQKSTQAMRDAKKAMADAEVEAQRTQRAVEALKKEIGDGSDKNSVNGAVAKAIQLFPEFENAIRSAAAEAARTENFEHLKQVLEDIAMLQKHIRSAEVRGLVVEANANAIGAELYNSTRWHPRSRWGVPQEPAYASTSKKIRKELEAQNLPTEAIKDVFNTIGEIAVSLGDIGDADKVVASAKKIVDELAARMVVDKLSPEEIVDLVYDIANSKQTGKYWEAGVKASLSENQSKQSAAALEYKTAKTAWEDQSNVLKESLKKREISQKDFQSRMEQNAEKFINTIIGIANLPENLRNEAYDLTKGYYPPSINNNSPGGGGGGSASKVKTDTDLVKDAIDDYDKELKKLDNRLSAGTITAEQYADETKKLVDKTWEAITAISNFSDILDGIGKGEFGKSLAGKYTQNRADEAFKKTTDEIANQLGELAKYVVPTKPTRDSSQDYKKTASEIEGEKVKIEFDYADALKKLIADFQTAIDKGEFDLVKDDAIEMLETLKTAAEDAAKSADDLQTKLDLSETVAKLDEQIKNLNSSLIDTFEGFANAMDRVVSGLWAIAQVFDEDLKDSPMFQAFEAFTTVLNQSIQIMQGVMAAIQLVQQIQDKAAKEKMKDAIISVAADKMAAKAAIQKATAEGTDAAASGAKSVANIPYVGPILAVAAAASIVAALLAAGSKLKGFAKGGIVGGNSFTGDNNIIRANSSEMVLTRGQQASLWKAIQSGNLGGNGKVEFVIRGDQLVGTIQNYNRLRR